MNPVWASFLAVVAKEGLSAAIKIFEVWVSNPELTATAIARLRELNKEDLESVVEQTKPQ